MISSAQLLAFAPASDAGLYAPLIDAACGRAGIITPGRLRHFMAQAAVETMYFQRFEEDLDYTAARILAVWPHRFTETNVTDYAHKPEALASAAYADRMGNGSEASGDGWKYRGRGLFQTTGRAAYAEAQGRTGFPFLAAPELMADPQHAVSSAVRFWTANDLNFLADRDDLTGITRRLNGGLTDIGLRQRAFARASTIWS